VTPRAEALLPVDEERSFRMLVQGAFGMRRKQMRRVIRSLRALDVPAAEAVLQASGIDPDARPETLSPDQFARLLRSLSHPGVA
jgi:Dimethyladenosine transferase (rRNA methylation)